MAQISNLDKINLHSTLTAYSCTLKNMLENPEKRFYTIEYITRELQEIGKLKNMLDNVK